MDFSVDHLFIVYFDVRQIIFGDFRVFTVVHFLEPEHRGIVACAETHDVDRSLCSKSIQKAEYDLSIGLHSSPCASIDQGVELPLILKEQLGMVVHEVAELRGVHLCYQCVV